LAILAALVVGELLIWLAAPDAIPNGWVTTMVLMIAALSFADDTVGLPPSVRLCGHGLAAIGAIVGAALTVHVVGLPVFGSISLGWFAVPFTLLFLVWITNLYNFMDGIDGFAGGMAVIGFGIVSYIAWSEAHRTLALLSLLIAASTAGFLYFNIPPAKIFMGDVGSISLGFLAGCASLIGIREGLFDLWLPLLIFSPFVVDSTVTLFRRLLRREAVWQAHCEHYYQRLVRSGWGHRRTVMAEYVLMLACGGSAVVYSRVGMGWRLALLIGWASTYVVLMGCVSIIERQQAKLSTAT